MGVTPLVVLSSDQKDAVSGIFADLASPSVTEITLSHWGRSFKATKVASFGERISHISLTEECEEFDSRVLWDLLDTHVRHHDEHDFPYTKVWEGDQRLNISISAFEWAGKALGLV